MKKVININFQGRVIPIEETAYDLLKQYLDSLRAYFANEEGRDEIMNDIEVRVGELFTEKLKSGATCITDEDVNNIIASMGRPEDFEAQGADAPKSPQPEYANTSHYAQRTKGFQRNADDKIIGGVCSGLANYLGLDPIIMRIVFILLAGALFWVYILLWIIVPSRSLQSNITKRLYRNDEQKILGGVCSGLAAYFNIDIWIPRLIFVFPFIIGLASGSNTLWWSNDWDFGFMPRMISGSVGWTMFVGYIILWIAVPSAKTSSEKLEMRGQKVNVNSIVSTVKSDLGATPSSTEKKNNSGIGIIVRVLIKAFFIFLFAIIALALFGVFIGLLFGGIALAPLKGFIFDGQLENILAWLTLPLLFLLPFVALITWVVRRLMGVKTKHHYLGVSFLFLWIMGVICAVMLFYLVGRNFKRVGQLDEEQVTISQPLEKLNVEVQTTDWKTYKGTFFGFEMDNDFPIYSKGDDSIFLNTVRINIVKSNDSLYHLYRIRSSQGATREAAMETAEKIVFEIDQQGETLVFPQGFFISRDNKFRNQRIWLVIEVPAGKTISFSKNIKDYAWVDINARNGRFNDEDWSSRSKMHTVKGGREYMMNADGSVSVINK